MRTTIIPAQITTVEDKIAGSLNLTQIIILMVPVLWLTLVYVVFYPSMKLAPYKIILLVIVSAICLILALRIKDKIVAEWLGVVLSYHLRPRFWLYNKNDVTNRTVDVPDIPEIAVTKRQARKTVKTPDQEASLSDIIKLEQLINSGKVAVRYQFENKRI